MSEIKVGSVVKLRSVPFGEKAPTRGVVVSLLGSPPDLFVEVAWMNGEHSLRSIWALEVEE